MKDKMVWLIFSIVGLSLLRKRAFAQEEVSPSELPQYPIGQYPVGPEFYLDLIRMISLQQGFEPALIAALISVETGGTWNPNIGSKERWDAGAGIGLMQVSQAASRDVGYIYNWQGLMNPTINVQIGVAYFSLIFYELKRLLPSLSSERIITYAISGYNVGRTKVRQIIRQGQAIPNASYVQSVLSNYRLLKTQGF